MAGAQPLRPVEGESGGASGEPVSAGGPAGAGDAGGAGVAGGAASRARPGGTGHAAAGARSAAGGLTTGAPPDEGGQLLGIGAAAARAGVSERALRYYQEIGLLTPWGRTPGGMRRYSEEDLARVARIRELQLLLGLNLDEIAAVLRSEDRTAEIRLAYRDEHTGAAERRQLLVECMGLLEDLRTTVEAKRAALDGFLRDLDARIERINELLA
jgi:MerR family transcriptional regulator, repressor of the yfmOP operon